ncbi:MAG: hypothetical protein AB7P20_26385, partial [Rhizobiaceae bacterium]
MGEMFGVDGLLRRYRDDRAGNFTVVAGVTMAMLSLAIGYGVNVAQIYNVRTNLVASLDAALTSTGRDISTGAIKEADAAKSIKAFLEANGATDVNNGNNKIMLVEPITIDRAAKTVKATAYVDVDAFLPLFGQANKTRVSTTAATLYSNKRVEIGLMLDVTGSMKEAGSPLNGKSQTKLQNLKTAATEAVENLLSRNQPGAEPRVRVAIIPYSQGVNTGVLADGNYVEYTPKSSGLWGTLWDLLAELGLSRIGPVTSQFGLTQPGEPERPVGLAALNNPPSNLTSQQRARLKKLDKALTAAREKVDDNCTTERKIKFPGKSPVFDPSDDSPNAAMINRDERLAGACPSEPVAPLTTDATKLKGLIDDLEADGGTAGHIGIQWTRYMLSPNWGDFLEARVDGSKPADYDDGVRKIAILMTDGEFNAAYAGVPDNERTSRDQETRSNDYAEMLCDAMKADDIEIFTIGFMLESGKDILKDCA